MQLTCLVLTFFTYLLPGDWQPAHSPQPGCEHSVHTSQTSTVQSSDSMVTVDWVSLAIEWQDRSVSVV